MSFTMERRGAMAGVPGEEYVMTRFGLRKKSTYRSSLEDASMIVTATKEGDVHKTLECLQMQGQDVHSQDGHGRTALHFASYLGHTEVGMLLLAAKANHEQADHAGNQAIHWSAYGGNSDLCTLLLTAGGVDMNAPNMGNNTALHMACMAGNFDVVSVLLSKKAEVNVRSRAGYTPLHWASYFGHVEVIAALLEAGADVFVSSRSGKTALDLARQRGHEEAVSVLLAGESRGSDSADINLEKILQEEEGLVSEFAKWPPSPEPIPWIV